MSGVWIANWETDATAQTMRPDWLPEGGMGTGESCTSNGGGGKDIRG